MNTVLYDGIATMQHLTFETIVCYKCHVPFAVTSRHRRELLDTQDTFYCPAGHPQHYIGKTEEQKLKEQLDKLKADKLKEEERLYNMYLDQMNETKKINRQLKRIHKGVCPCCNRSFVDLKRHMETKHPEIISAKK